MHIQATHSSVALTPVTQRQPAVSPEKQTIQESARLSQDTLKLSGLGSTIQNHPVVFTGLAGASTGAIVGAGVGYLIPTAQVGTGVALGAGFGAGAGLVAGAGSALIVDKWLEGKVSSSTVGLVSGALAGAASGALLGMKLGGSKLMGAAAMAVPGAVAGLVGGLSASAIKRSVSGN